MANSPSSGASPADPWQDSRPHCRVHSDSPLFRSVLEDAIGGTVTLLESEPCGARETVLVDCRRPGDDLARARNRFPRLPLVGVLAQSEASRMVELLAGGADGVMVLGDPPATWRECLHVVLGGGRWVGGPGLEVCLEQKHALYGISTRERHEGEVTQRTRLFVRSRVGDKIPT